MNKKEIFNFFNGTHSAAKELKGTPLQIGPGKGKIGMTVRSGMTMNGSSNSVSGTLLPVCLFLEELFTGKMNYWVHSKVVEGQICFQCLIETEKGYTAAELKSDGHLLFFSDEKRLVELARAIFGYTLVRILFLDEPCFKNGLDENMRECKELFEQMESQLMATSFVSLELLMSFSEKHKKLFSTIFPKEFSKITIRPFSEWNMNCFDKDSAFTYENSTFQSRRKEEETVKKEEKDPVQEIYENALSGMYQIPYDWDEESEKMIPDRKKLESYVPNEFFAMALKRIWRSLKGKLENNDSDFLNLMAISDPGAGKTHGFYAIGAALRIPVYTVSLTPTSEEDKLTGITRFIKTVPQSIETAFVNGFLKGGIVLLEEPNLADPGMLMGAVSQALEAPYLIERFGYELKKRHPLAVVAAAMNVGTVGTSPLNEALNNRFSVTYHLKRMDVRQGTEVLKKKGYDEDSAYYVYSKYEEICRFLQKTPRYQAVISNLSIRTCIGALDILEDGFSKEQAIENSFINKIRSVNPKAADAYLEYQQDMAENEILLSAV